MKTLLVIVVASLAACSPIFDEDSCESSTTLAVKSADERYLATVVDQACGATTARSKIVYLRATVAGASAPEHGEPVYIYAGQASLGVEWEGQILIIKSVSKGDNVFLAKSAWHDVNIRYR